MLFDDEIHKLNFIKQLLADDIRLSYIDLDLVITGYIKSKFIEPKADIELYIPEDLGELISVIAEQSSEYVVIDSSDTLEALCNDHLQSIYISILAKSSKVIVIGRSKRWFLEQLSDVIIVVSNNISIIKPNLEFDNY